MRSAKLKLGSIRPEKTLRQWSHLRWYHETPSAFFDRVEICAHAVSGVARISAALSTPQICLHELNMKGYVRPRQRYKEHLGHQNLTLTNCNRSRFSFPIMGLAFSARRHLSLCYSCCIFHLYICIYAGPALSQCNRCRCIAMVFR